MIIKRNSTHFIIVSSYYSAIRYMSVTKVKGRNVLIKSLWWMVVGGRWVVGIHTVQYCLSCWVKIVFLSQSNNNKRVDLLKHYSSMARWGDIDWARCLIFRCWGTQFVILTAIIYWLVGLFVARKSPWHSACNFLMGFVPLSLYGHHLWWWQLTGMKWFMFCK